MRFYVTESPPKRERRVSIKKHPCSFEAEGISPLSVNSPAGKGEKETLPAVDAQITRGSDSGARRLPDAVRLGCQPRNKAETDDV